MMCLRANQTAYMMHKFIYHIKTERQGRVTHC